MNSRDIWIGAIALVVVVGLGLWWYSANGPVGLGSGNMSTSSSATTTIATTSTLQAVNRTTSSVAVVAESISGASRFGGLLQSTGVGAKLTGKGPYTIFVPTDGAVSQLPRGTIANMTSAQLRRFVEYSIVKGRAIDTTAETSGSIQALSGDALNFSFENNIARVGNAIISTRYNASNGVVYVVSGVLLPPTPSQ